jgi:hypothetical protein
LQSLRPTGYELSVGTNDTHLSGSRGLEGDRGCRCRDLYVSVISIGDAGRMRVLFPYVDFPEGRERLTPGQTLTVPDPGVIFASAHLVSWRLWYLPAQNRCEMP